MRTSSRARTPSSVMTAHAALWAMAGLSAAVYLGWSTFGPAVEQTATVKSDRGGEADDRGTDKTVARLSHAVRQVQDRLIAGDEQTQFNAAGSGANAAYRDRPNLAPFFCVRYRFEQTEPIARFARWQSCDQ